MLICCLKPRVAQFVTEPRRGFCCYHSFLIKSSVCVWLPHWYVCYYMHVFSVAPDFNHLQNGGRGQKAAYTYVSSRAAHPSRRGPRSAANDPAKHLNDKEHKLPAVL